jgi:hypothetical protein
MSDDGAPAAPVPRRLYIHDDLTDDVSARHGAGSPAVALAQELMALVCRDAGRVTVLTLPAQLDALVAGGRFAPFALALGIGHAGCRVASQVHARTGWFPRIAMVDLTREENGDGYAVVSLSGTPLAAQLEGAGAAASLAIVDDTIFSGLTMRTLLEALSPAARGRAHAFCLRGVADSVAALQRLCPVSAGFTAAGRLLDEVSLINASGLVRRGAIRRAGHPPLAFYERPAWLRAWFPRDAEAIIDRCRRLNAWLEPDGRASLPMP